MAKDQDFDTFCYYTSMSPWICLLLELSLAMPLLSPLEFKFLSTSRTDPDFWECPSDAMRQGWSAVEAELMTWRGVQDDFIQPK